MLCIHFTTDDLVRTTVAPTVDPLWEVVSDLLTPPESVAGLEAGLAALRASVSRHTGVLRGAGLLRTTRHGMRTVHSLTTLGEALVAGRMPAA